MEKDVEEFLGWLENKEGRDTNYISLWDIPSLLDNPAEKTLRKIFTSEQLRVLKVVLDKIIWTLDEWHNKEDEESHKDIRTELKKTDAHLRNHRHETGKTFSAKAEF